MLQGRSIALLGQQWELVIVMPKHNHHKGMKWRRYLHEEVHDLYTEVENYLQRWSPLLVAKETESQGSELMSNLSSVRRSLRSISRILVDEDKDEDKDIRLRLSRRDRDHRYSLRIGSQEQEIALFMAREGGAGSPVMSLRKFAALGRKNVGGNADGGKEWAFPLPEEQMGDFMSGIDKRWLPGDSDNEDDESAPHHARAYLDKLLRFPTGGEEVAWFNVVHMYKYFRPHLDEGRARAGYEAVCHELLRFAAQRGYAAALHTLGMIQYHGFFGQTDTPGEAELWFRRAAKGGHPDAQYQLGVLCLAGKGLAEDVEQARYWFERARKSGNADAETALIELDRPNVDRPNENQNRIVLKEAAEKGNATALYELGEMWRGNFMEQYSREVESFDDPNERPSLDKEELKNKKECTQRFLRHYKEAAKRGHVAAQYKLGQIYSEDRVSADRVLNYAEPVRIIDIDVNSAAHWFLKIIRRRGIEQRYEQLRKEAAVALAKLYVQGRLSAANPSRRRDASRWLSTDVNNGAKMGLLHSTAKGSNEPVSLDAQYVLGAIYREGIRDEESSDTLVEPDFCMAKSFLESAAGKGHVGAQNRLGVMLRDSCGYRCERCPRKDSGCSLRRAFDLFRTASGCHQKETTSIVEWWNARTNLGDMYDDGFGGSMENKENLEPYDHFSANVNYNKMVQEIYAKCEAEDVGYYGPPIRKQMIWKTPKPEEEFFLGVMYREGRTVEKDVCKAITCFCNAAQLVAAQLAENMNPREAVRNLEEWGQKEPGNLSRKKDLKKTFLLKVRRYGRLPRSGFGAPIIGVDNLDRPYDLWPVAEYALGDIYENGLCRKQKNTVLAKALYRSACSRYEDGSIGHARSEYKLARIYEREGRHSNARKWYLKAAERRRDGGCGHPRAQYRLGKMYERGEEKFGCERDGDMAKCWYLQSARPRWDEMRGFDRAQYRLGSMYESGWERQEPSKKEAARWYAEAAERRGEDRPGHAVAQYRLGCLYECGWEGQEPSKKEAARWYAEAAERRGEDRPGHAVAQYRLGCLYECGWEGQEPSKKEAARWYGEAAERRGGNRPGHAGAQYRLGSLYECGWEGQGPSKKEAARWYAEAAERRGEDRPGHAVAQYRLGSLYESGWEGQEASAEDAERWYREAADQDHVEALEWFVERKDDKPRYEYRLGRKYEASCEDLPEDTDRAKKLYGRAGREGASRRHVQARSHTSGCLGGQVSAGREA